MSLLNRYRKRIASKRPPTKGDQSYVAICLANPDRSAPVEQLLGGYTYVVTLPASPANGDYTLVVAGVTYTFAADTSTATAIIQALAAKINLGTTGCIANGEDFTARTFRITRESTFSVSAVSPTSSMTVGSVQTQSATSKGATSITLPLALRGPILAGNYICFVDADENYTPVKLTSDAAAGATAVQVEAIPKAIAAGAAAEFPAYLWDATQADANRSYNRQEATTFNTGTDSDGAITTGNKTFSIQSLYNANNAGLSNCYEATKRGVELYLIRDFAPPSGYLRGRRLAGNCVVTGLNDTAPVGNVTVSPQFAFNGTTVDDDPLPLPY